MGKHMKKAKMRVPSTQMIFNLVFSNTKWTYHQQRWRFPRNFREVVTHMGIFYWLINQIGSLPPPKAHWPYVHCPVNWVQESPILRRHLKICILHFSKFPPELKVLSNSLAAAHLVVLKIFLCSTLFVWDDPSSLRSDQPETGPCSAEGGF